MGETTALPTDDHAAAQCFELTSDDEVGCVQCMKDHRGFLEPPSYRRGEAVLLDMRSSPYGDGQAHYVCNEHLKFFFGSNVARFDHDLDETEPE